jgi:hypothetical protein
MDKLMKLLVLIILFSSCSKNIEFDKNYHEIIFVYEKWTNINLETGNLQIDFLGLKYRSKIVFSNQDKLMMINSFNKYKIGNKMDEVWSMDENSFMPPCNDEIWVYHNTKIQSKLIINANYTIDTFQWHNQEYRIVSFRNDIKKVLENNNDFKRALDTLHKFQKQKKALFL